MDIFKTQLPSNKHLLFISAHKTFKADKILEEDTVTGEGDIAIWYEKSLIVKVKVSKKYKLESFKRKLSP